MYDDELEVPGRPGPSVRSLLLQDTRPIDPVLLEDRNDYLGEDATEVDLTTYWSREAQALENERLWSRVWQIACREEQIPKVGDHVLYEVADKSLIIVRSAPDEISALFNACAHRGRTLCDGDGHSANFRCKFHGWVYGLDGRLGVVPSDWDFPHLQREQRGLVRAQVGRWGGFVFVNMDPEAIPFDAYIKGVPEHADRWDFENRFIAGHIGQVVRANWKVAAEAFLENYHVMATHKQVLPYVGDANSQYTVRKDHPHHSRLIFCVATPSPHVADTTSEEQVRDVLSSGGGTRRLYDIDWPLPDGKTLRECAADDNRRKLTQSTGRDFSQVSDSEMIDGWVYSLFPNFTLWGGYSNICYRFRPWQNDPELSLMEVMLLPPTPKDGPRPPAAKMTLLGPDQNFTDAPELGEGGAFFNQDLGNMCWVQKGLRTSGHRRVMFADYQESQLRHFHRTLALYLDGDRPR